MTSVHIEHSSLTYDRFFEQNLQIEYLRCCFTENVCRTIADRPAIRDLTLEKARMLTENDIAYLGHIEDLRVSLVNLYLDDSIRKIFSMENVVSLELYANSFDENLLIDLIKNLKSLEKL